jgi:hypothetical protein
MLAPPVIFHDQNYAWCWHALSDIRDNPKSAVLGAYFILSGDIML